MCTSRCSDGKTNKRRLKSKNIISITSCKPKYKSFPPKREAFYFASAQRQRQLYNAQKQQHKNTLNKGILRNSPFWLVKRPKSQRETNRIAMRKRPFCNRLKINAVRSHCKTAKEQGEKSTPNRANSNIAKPRFHINKHFRNIFVTYDSLTL